jgi:glycosyltransferase involved in cell wall biosynthesis
VTPQIHVYWQQPNGYIAACLNELTRTADVSIWYPIEQKDTAYEVEKLFDPCVQLYPWRRLGDKLFQPHVVPELVIICGWRNWRYLKRAFFLRRRSVRLLTMDNPWLETPRQKLAVVVSRAVRALFFDKVFVPGQLQRQFALNLGFPDEAVATGSYACDVSLFSNSYNELSGRSRSLLFVGRLVEEKGIRALLRAWEQHKAQHPSPLDLRVVGSGPLAEIVDASGAKLLGFLPQKEVAREMAIAYGFILPSLNEPWGVVIQEAVISGLPIIASNSCGSVEFFVSRVNGWTFEADDIETMAKQMNLLADLDPEDWIIMSRNSRLLGAAPNPSTWSRQIMDMIVTERPRRL